MSALTHPAKKALILCQESLLTHLNKTWLNDYYQAQYHQNSQDVAPATAHYHAIIIDSMNFPYVEQHITHLLTLLAEDGYFIMQPVYGTSARAWLEQFNFPLIFSHNKNKQWVWIFIKKSYGRLMYHAHTALENKQLATCLTLAKQALAQKPHDEYLIAIVAILMLKINQKDLAFQLWFDLFQQTGNVNHLYWAVLNTLLANDYHAGFTLREKIRGRAPYHWRTKVLPPDDALRWRGEDLSGKTLVVWTEFGLGDEIMFAQLAHALKRQAKKVIFVVQDPICDIMQTHPDIDEVIPASQAHQTLKDFDYWEFPHAILAHIPTPDFANLPKRLPYLFAHAEKQTFFAEKMATAHPEALRVGIVWRGNPNHENDLFRSIHDLQLLDQFLQQANIVWYACQQQITHEELAVLTRNRVHILSTEFKDMSDTAGALNNLDVLVTVDTSVAHLAGALGVPTVVLLPFVVDWRWGVDSPTCMWYKNMRLFRNPSAEASWQSTLNEVSEYLQALAVHKCLYKGLKTEKSK